MADITNKKYLDLVGLEYYDSKIKSLIDAKSEMAENNAKDYTDQKIGTLDAAYTTVAGAIAGEAARAAGVEGTLTSLTTDAKGNLVAAINEVNANADAAQADVDALEAVVGVPSGEGTAASGLTLRIENLEAAIGSDGAVADQIDAAIEALDSTKDQTAGADGLALHIKLEDGKVTELTGSIAAETYDAYGAAAAEKTRAEGVEGTLASLTTEAKGNLVAAINEVDANADAAQAAADAAQDDVDALEALVGTIPADATAKTVVEYAKEVADAAVKAAADANDDMDERVAALEATHATVTVGEGDDAHEEFMTVQAEAAAEVAKIVASAPASFDTLKEIADWIGTGDVENTTAATMLSDIATLKGANTVPGSVANTVKNAVDALDATVTNGVEEGTQPDVVVTVTEVDGKLTAVTANVTANRFDAYGAAAAVQGDTTETVASLDARLNAMEDGDESVDAKIEAAIDDLDASIDNGEGNDVDITIEQEDGLLTSVTATLNFERITETEIDGLFPD